MNQDHDDLSNHDPVAKLHMLPNPYPSTITTCEIKYPAVTAEVTQPHIPADAMERKKIPLWSGLVKYFPDALVAVAQLSQVANDQHNPGEPLHWSREKSADHEDTLLRHLFDSGTLDSDGQRHSTKLAWRALAKLQLEIERDREK